MREILRWSRELRARYGERVQKVAIDIGAGCPNRRGLTSGGCVFCDERGGGSGAFLNGVSLREQIRKGVSGAQKHYKTRSIVLYFQSYSATNLPLERFARAVEVAEAIAAELGAIVRALSVGTRPDLLPRGALDYLDSLAARRETWLELGVQTTDPAGLAWLRRGHGTDAVYDALRRARKTRLKICAHLVAGIPGEADDQLARSAVRLAASGVRAFKFHPLHVLKGTELEKLYRQGTFIPLSKEDYIRKVVAALKALPDGIVVQRLNAGARPGRLVAPAWLLDKEGMEREIVSRFYGAGL